MSTIFASLNNVTDAKALEIVKAYIESGGDKDVRHAYDRTLLMHEVMCRHVLTVSYLISIGANVNAVGRYLSPLAYAVPSYSERGNAKIIKALLDAGADVNHQDDIGRTILSFLAFDSVDFDVETIQHLLAAGADPNHQDNSGRVPLIGPVSRGDALLVRILLDAGASPWLKDGTTVLSWASFHNPEVTKMIEDAINMSTEQD
jgi:ankyrin repeat protein